MKALTAIDSSLPQGYDQIIPIVFATDDNFSIYAAVAIESILKNAGSQNFYRIYVLYDKLSQEHIDGLEGIKSSQAVVECIDVRPYTAPYKELFLEKKGHLSIESYFRFFIAEIFSCYEKVIYLDCDLVVCSDVAELISLDIGEHPVAGVRDYILPSGKQYLEETHALDSASYINGGVMLINVAKWKQIDLAKELFSTLERIPAEKLMWHDQDVLNIVCKDKIYYLGDEYNFFGSLLYSVPEYKKLFARRIKQVGNDFKILHYPSSLKPWSNPDLPFADVFWRYAGTSVFLTEIIRKEFHEIQNSYSENMKNVKYSKEYYENTTSWKITKPIRVLGDIIKKFR